jgi:hypothetical protein
MLDVAWHWCGHFGEEKNLLSLLEFEPWITQLVA